MALSRRLWLLGALLACDDQAVGNAPCEDIGDCQEMQACLEGVCRAVECISSAHCQLHEYCDVRAFRCMNGCQDDEDCAAGESCDVERGRCAQDGCRDTVLDCEYGEICDTQTGACEFDDRAHCQSCDRFERLSCPDMGTCVTTINWKSSCESDDDCPLDQHCDEFAGSKLCHMDLCQYKCDPDDANACPRGYDCLGGATEQGYYVCTADCAWMEESGFLPSQQD